MEYLVCYDLADDRRRARMSAALLDYGERIQESVFVAHLDDELFGRMMARLERLLEASEDTVHVVALCAACEGRVRVLGKAVMPQDRPFYVV